MPPLTRYAFFPFFSSLFFFFFGRRKWKTPAALRRWGEAEPRLVGEQEDHPTQNDVLLLPVLLLFFFFSILAVENGEIQSSCVVGERRSQSSFVVGSSGKKKTSQPKTTSFWVGLIFFFKIKTPQNDVVLRCFIFLKSEHPKRRRFEVFYFFIFKNDKPKTTSFWASSNQNDAVLGCLSLQPYKTPLFLGFHPKTQKKAFKNTLKSGLKREEEEDSKRYFFFHFSYFCCEKNSYKSRETFLKIEEFFSKNLEKKYEISEN